MEPEFPIDEPLLQKYFELKWLTRGHKIPAPGKGNNHRPVLEYFVFEKNNFNLSRDLQVLAEFYGRFAIGVPPLGKLRELYEDYSSEKYQLAIFSRTYRNYMKAVSMEIEKRKSRGTAKEISPRADYIFNGMSVN